MALHSFRRNALILALVVLAGLAGCASLRVGSRLSSRDCMARVMYFESNRSSDEGMIAVGTVVMNRVDSPDFPNSVCAVVGQKNQFAPGVLTRSMEVGKERAYRNADRVLKGARHAQVGSSEFFHTAGLKFPYENMFYMAVAGGNAFYVKLR
ncbi:cell wall hydrolase [Consotaella aegiceratis]|uniref:cell wall hydrolase n=1 Tax=Consotaella aegiceratis TaxID=3097961 RepID=UPI002F40DCFC